MSLNNRGYVCAGEGYSDYPVLTEIKLSDYVGNSATPVANGKNWYIKTAANGTGCYIYNVAVGKFLNGNDTQIDFGDIPEVWVFEDKTKGGVTYKNIKDFNSTAAKKYLSAGCARAAGDRPMAYDNNTDDGGAIYTIAEVANGLTTYAAAVTAANNAISKEENKSQEEKVNEAKANIQIGVGYPRTDSEAYTALNSLTSEATDEEINTALSNYITCEDIQLPESGKAYTIKAWWKTRQLPFTFFSATENGVFLGNTPVYAPNSKEGAEAVKFVCQEVNGKYFFVSDNGYYLGWQAYNKAYYTGNSYSEDQPFAIKKSYIKPGDSDAVAGTARNNVTLPELLGKVCLQAVYENGTHNLMFSFSTKQYHSASELSTWYADNEHTVYYIIEEVLEEGYSTNVVDVKPAAELNGSYLATFYAPYATTLPAYCQAYTINEVNADKTSAKLTLLEGDIPANTGVIIKSNAAGKKTFGLSVTNPSAVEDNMLFGSVTDSYVLAEGAYVLANGESGVGLYKPTANKGENGGDGRTHFKNNAGRAYLSVGESPVRFLNFDFGTETGIENIVDGIQENENAVVYDLSGRRVQNMQKGIYVVNGKKVIK